MSLRARGATKYEIPKEASGQSGASFFRHFPRGNDEIRLCARATRLGGPIAFLKRVKILTEGTDSVTECLIILGDSLASLDTSSQKVFVCQNTSKKNEKRWGTLRLVMQVDGVSNARCHARYTTRYNTRCNARCHASRYEQSVERTAQIVHFPCTWAILIASYVQDAQ